MKAVMTSGIPELNHRLPIPQQYITTNQLFDRKGDFVGGEVTLFIGTEFEARPHPQGHGWELIITWGQPRLPTGTRICLDDIQFKQFMTPGTAVKLRYRPPGNVKR